MIKEEFLKARTPVYIDDNTGILLKVSQANLKDQPFTTIFYELKIPWLNTTRGYLYKDFLVLYVNDYEIPNLNMIINQYLFSHLKDIKWIGYGCYKSKPGEFWEPKLKVYRNDLFS